jgi:hypothetical protein
MKIMQEFKQNSLANNEHHSKSIEKTSREHRTSKSYELENKKVDQLTKLRHKMEAEM